MGDMRVLLQEKEKIAEQVYQNTLLQAEAVGAEEEEKLLELLEKREALIKKLGDIDQAMKENTGQQKEDHQSQQAKIRRILQAAYDQDQKNQQGIREALQKVKASMQQLHTSKNAMTNGYLKQDTQAYGYFLDKKN